LNVTHAAVSFFQIAATGKSVVYVIDRSASMGQNGSLEAAKKELQASLETLSADVQFQIVLYNRRAEVVAIRGKIGLVPATRENKEAALAVVDSIYAEGSTEHVPGLKQALLLHPDVVYLLTDANDLKAEQVRAVTLQNNGRSSIHAVQINPESPCAALNMLAQENRGVFRAIQVER
jgi:hypothetical protein